MHRLIASLLLVATLTSCSWKDALDFISPSKSGGINTELVLGNKKEELEVKTEIGATTQTANTIVNEDNASAWLIFIAALGWFMPTPQGMFRMWRSRNDKE